MLSPLTECCVDPHPAIAHILSLSNLARICKYLSKIVHTGTSAVE